MFGGGWWVSNYYQVGGIALVAARVIWVILSITLHELAHGWAAIGRGDQTPRLSGHMSVNPVVHMGPQSLIMLAIFGIAWGQMPIDPTRMRGRYAEAWVAFAGPLMNFVLAVICILSGGIMLAFMSDAQVHHFLEAPYRIGTTTDLMLPKLAMFALVGGTMNIGLGIFNLIPVPPLDGSRILGNFSSAYHRFTNSDGGRVGTTIVYVLAFLLAGTVIWPVGFYTTGIGMHLVGTLLKLAGIGHP